MLNINITLHKNELSEIINGAEDDPTQFQQGWMLMTATNTHYAIAEERETIDGTSGWWVIDSNYVDPVGGHVIGKHFMSDATLTSRGYRGTEALLGTDNFYQKNKL